MTARPDPCVGTELGPYHVERVIGRGGMGVVYLATHTGMQRRVALKLLAPEFADDEAFRARFLRESHLAAAIDHPNIIPIYEAGEVEGVYFLAMRYVEGTDLQARLAGGPLAPRATVTILGQVASALDAAHAAGLVHRDVKPANVLIAPGQTAERADHAYLTDFGLTKQRGADSGLTRAGSFLGTVDYIAPEQIEGRQLDGRADQYALAAIAVAALSGEAPFPRDSDVAVINAHLHDEPPSLHARRPELPAAADAVVRRAMAKRPADRYPDCRAFVDDLRRALGVTETDLHRVPASPARRLALLAAGLGVLLVAAVAVAVASGALTGGPAASPAPGSSGAALSSPSASAAAGASAAAASATLGPFPNEVEAAILAALPSTLAKTCVRGGTSDDAKLAGFVGRTWSPQGGVGDELNPGSANGGVTCRPSTGAARLYIMDLGQGGASLTLGFFLSKYQIPSGSCASQARATEQWTGPAGSGVVACMNPSPYDGRPWIYFTFGGKSGSLAFAGRYLGFATRDDANYDALYQWFDSLRTFLP